MTSARGGSPSGRPSGCCSATAISGGSADLDAEDATSPGAARSALHADAQEAAASLGISLNHFERWVQPELKLVSSGQLLLVPMAELERWVQRHARLLVDAAVRPLRSDVG